MKKFLINLLTSEQLLPHTNVIPYHNLGNVFANCVTSWTPWTKPTNTNYRSDHYQIHFIDGSCSEWGESSHLLVVHDTAIDAIVIQWLLFIWVWAVLVPWYKGIQQEIIVSCVSTDSLHTKNNCRNNGIFMVPLLFVEFELQTQPMVYIIYIICHVNRSIFEFSSTPSKSMLIWILYRIHLHPFPSISVSTGALRNLGYLLIHSCATKVSPSNSFP